MLLLPVCSRLVAFQAVSLFYFVEFFFQGQESRRIILRGLRLCYECYSPKPLHCAEEFPLRDGEAAFRPFRLDEERDPGSGDLSATGASGGFDFSEKCAPGEDQFRISKLFTGFVSIMSPL